MRPTWKVLLLLLALGLAVPATVVAQSAGDEQYVDPFEGQGNGNDGGGNGGGGNDSQTDSQTESDDGTTATAQTTPSDTAGTTAEGTESAEGTLPRTGLPLMPVVLTGLFLVGAGATLRRTTRLAPAPTLAPALAPAPIVAMPQGAITGTATPPRSGVPAIGLGLVGLFILSTLLRRRA